MNIKPLGDNVILNPAKKEEKTASGIVLPETVNKEQPEQGEVIAVGPGKLNSEGKRLEMSVKVGDTILFKKYGPDEIKIDGQDVLVVSEGDIIAILN
jgi:chaperonin GroES